MLALPREGLAGMFARASPRLGIDFHTDRLWGRWLISYSALPAKGPSSPVRNDENPPSHLHRRDMFATMQFLCFWQASPFPCTELKASEMGLLWAFPFVPLYSHANDWAKGSWGPDPDCGETPAGQSSSVALRLVFTCVTSSYSWKSCSGGHMLPHLRPQICIIQGSEHEGSWRSSPVVIGCQRCPWWYLKRTFYWLLGKVCQSCYEACIEEWRE